MKRTLIHNATIVNEGLRAKIQQKCKDIIIFRKIVLDEYRMPFHYLYLCL